MYRILTLLLFLFPFNSLLFSGTIENTYEINQQISLGDSTYYVQINGAPSNAVITNVEARFTYIAYNGVEKHLSCRFNRGECEPPGSNCGAVLVAQGTLSEGYPPAGTTLEYVSFDNWNGLSVNTNYYFRFTIHRRRNKSTLWSENRS